MSALVIDTSSWVSYFASGGASADAIETALAESRVHLPPVVAAELLSAKMSDTHRDTLERLLRDLPLCAGGLEHWFEVGRLRRSLFAKGLSVSTPDAHVARCAIELDAELMTEDNVFRLIARHQPLRLAANA